MIEHCVFCNLKSDVPFERFWDLACELEKLAMTLPGVLGFTKGKNLDVERKSQDFPVGFIVRFDTMAALQGYADHPDHKRLGAALCELCVGGADGIVVFDLKSD